MKPNEKETIETFITDKSFFTGYETFYGEIDYTLSEIAAVEPQWYEYVNNSLNPDLFKTDISQFLQPSTEIQVVYDERIKDLISQEEIKTKDIGNIG